MLKRSDQELVIFNQIDAERERAEAEYYKQRGAYTKKNNGQKYKRLIQEEELPEVYRYEEQLAEDVSSLVEYGRGQRAKDHVRYDDGLTEEQWVNALEDENIDMEELIAKKEARRRKAAGLPPLEETVPASKKRGRPKKGEPEATSKKRRGAKKDDLGPDPVPPHIRQQMTRIFELCYKAVEESTDEDEETYRKRCVLFMDLVSKRDYPIYYTMIKKPIAMKMIKKRIHSTYYRTVAQFRDEFHLMFDNARTFNEEGSLVYQDADEMQVRR